jgi:serine/threonine protein phosphatase PrpC
MKTVAAKDIFKKKVQDIPKKSAKNVKEDKMNVTYNKAKSSLIVEKNNNSKNDKNYLTNKEKTTVVKFSTKKTKKIDGDEKKKKRKQIIGKSADRAANRKGNKSKKDVTKKNNKRKESNSDSLTESSQSSSVSSSITPSSSSYTSEDEKDEKAKPSILSKSKTNINTTSTKLEEADNQNQKGEEKKENQNPQDQKILDNVPNLAAIRPPPPNGRKGSIILGTKYLRRRSMDNPYTRERLELLVNEMTLKQNGGNTLFLKNYEPGPTYLKEITHITKDRQTIKKHIKISSCTKAGCKGPGIVKTNQDAFFIKENFLKNNEYFYIGVCDGHGEFGHVVSNFVINKLPSYIKDLSNESITSAFKKTNSEIYGNSKLDSSMSGTTVVSIVLTPNNIQCVNLGDSRAALFKYDNGIYYCKNLSRDHKPAEADEARRIDLMGGRIKRCYDEDHKRFVGPERVWMKNKDEPGLAMTRSLGDKIAHNIGVSDEPEFKTFPYDGTEKYIIIASDGLWEYISGDQCIAIVKPFYEEGLDAQEAALALTKEAFRRWKRKEVAIDDITVVVIFFY